MAGFSHLAELAAFLHELEEALFVLFGLILAYPLEGIVDDADLCLYLL